MTEKKPRVADLDHSELEDVIREDLRKNGPRKPTALGPDTIHGLPVIAMCLTPKTPGTRPGRVIIVDKGEREKFGRYVVAWQGIRADGSQDADYASTLMGQKIEESWDPEWDQGDYCSTMTEALESFQSRCRRFFR